MGVLAKHPTRALPSALPQMIQDSGRALLFTTLLGDVWISGAVMYGEPNSHQYPAYLRNNEQILHHLSAHVCNLCSGPRFVSGDWNVEQDGLPAFGLLMQAGFRDIQDIALERWGVSIRPTCKGKTRKDFLYISPELQELLIGVSVTDDVWPDHSVLLGKFRGLINSPRVWVWPAPTAFPWPSDFCADVAWPACTADMTTSYAQLWTQIEHEAAEQCPFPVPKPVFGRGQRTQPKKTGAHTVAPTKLGRKGDFQPEFLGVSTVHAQWLRQVRRLQTYARLATSQSSHAAIQKAEMWGAIGRATGFVPDFATWWNTCAFRTADAPEQCPCAPPDAQVAAAMFSSVSIALRELETQLRQTSRQYAKYRRDCNPNLVFADIKPPAVPGVDVLLQPIRAVVESLDAETGQIVLDQPCKFDEAAVISCAGKPLDVIYAEGDALWVMDLTNVEVGQVVSQTKFVGQHSDLETAFVQVWQERWMRHADVPPDRWSTIVAFVQR